MSEFPPGFDFSSLKRKEDTVLRRIVSKKFSRKATDYIVEKYMFEIIEKSFAEYMAAVTNLVSECETEEEFVEKLEALNSTQELPIL